MNIYIVVFTLVVITSTILSLRYRFLINKKPFGQTSRASLPMTKREEEYLLYTHPSIWVEDAINKEFPPPPKRVELTSLNLSLKLHEGGHLEKEPDYIEVARITTNVLHASKITASTIYFSA